MSGAARTIWLSLRLATGTGIAIGPGKADLLAAVAANGSIAAAARSMGMSYKKAWYLLDTMNRCFREPVVTTEKGGRGQGGARLTPLGQRALDLYRAIAARATAAAAGDIDALAALLADDSQL